MPGKVTVTFVVLGLFVAGNRPAAQQPSAATPRDLVGTWQAVLVERLDAGGKPTTVPNPRGQLILDAAGHVSEIVTRGDRVPYAGAQPTPAEAQRVYADYSDLWGRYRLDPQRRTITYAVLGSVDPNHTDQEIQRADKLEGKRLTIASTTTRPDATRGTRITC